jgi:biotin operon repressor
MGRRRSFSDDDNDYIVNNAPVDTAEEMGEAIGRTGAAVSTQISKLRARGWTITINTQKGHRNKGKGKNIPKLANNGYSFTYPDVPDFQRLTD